MLEGETDFLARQGDAVEPLETTPEVVLHGTAGRLRQRDGGCVFLDEELRCRSYEERPLYCRLFPLICDSYPCRQIDADFSCPGLGEGIPFSAADIEAVATGEAAVTDLKDWERQQLRQYHFASKRLKQAAAHAPEAEVLAALLTLVRAELWQTPFPRVGEALENRATSIHGAAQQCGNLTTRDQVLTLLGYEPPLEVQGDLDGRAAALEDYLLLWTRRTLLLRAAHAQALAAIPVRNVASHFLDLLALIARTFCEVCVYLDEGAPCRDTLRQLDGPLRARLSQAAILV